MEGRRGEGRERERGGEGRGKRREEGREGKEEGRGGERKGRREEGKRRRGEGRGKRRGGEGRGGEGRGGRGREGKVGGRRKRVLACGVWPWLYSCRTRVGRRLSTRRCCFGWSGSWRRDRGIAHTYIHTRVHAELWVRQQQGCVLCKSQ